MHNKKGFLLAEETLKIIITVIAIGFLVYFLVSLYFANQETKELKQAEETLKFLLTEAEAGRASVDIYNPKNWWISSWSQEVETGLRIVQPTQHPEYCSNREWEACICICSGAAVGQCNEMGVCLESSGFAIESKAIKIDNPPININIDSENKLLIKGT